MRTNSKWNMTTILGAIILTWFLGTSCFAGLFLNGIHIVNNSKEEIQANITDESLPVLIPAYKSKLVAYHSAIDYNKKTIIEIYSCSDEGYKDLATYTFSSYSPARLKFHKDKGLDEPPPYTLCDIYTPPFLALQDANIYVQDNKPSCAAKSKIKRNDAISQANI